MDISDAIHQQKLEQVSLLTFYSALEYSLGPVADHPLEVLAALCAVGLTIFSSRPAVGASVREIDVQTVSRTLELAIAERLVSDATDNQFLKGIRFLPARSASDSKGITFSEAWVSREDVRRAYNSLKADRFPWPKVPWGVGAKDWGWFDCQASLEAPPGGAFSPGSTAPQENRRSLNKQDTQRRYELWRREAEKLRNAHPGKSESWIAQRIAKNPETSGGRSSETIRKHIRKP